jgi:hypothetical protein
MKILNQFVFLILLFAMACSEDESVEVKNSDLGYNYQPLVLGQELIYQVDSITYDDFTGTVDTISYKLRELIEETDIDQIGNEVFIVSVYTRLSDTNSWKKKKVIQKSIVNTRYEKLENNLLTIPLVFPISKDVSWNVNSLNTNEEVIYSYDSFHEFGEYNNLDYDSVLVVNQLDEENLIEKIYSQEVYASGVGLIEKKHQQLNTNIDGTIKNGFDLTIKLLSANP